MQSPELQVLTEELVFLRTAAGQREAVWGLELDPAQRRLLLLVNGYTPLPDLVERHLDPREVPGLVQHLVGAGLIERVPQSGQSN